MIGEVCPRPFWPTYTLYLECFLPPLPYTQLGLACWHWRVPSYTLFQGHTGSYQPSTIMALPDDTFCKPLHALQGVVMWHYHGFQILHQRSNLPPPPKCSASPGTTYFVSDFEIICPPRLVRTPDPSGCARTRRVWGPWPCAKDTRRDVDSWLVENGFTLLRSKLFPQTTLWSKLSPSQGEHIWTTSRGDTMCSELCPRTLDLWKRPGDNLLRTNLLPEHFTPGGDGTHVQIPYWGLRFWGWDKINLAQF